MDTISNENKNLEGFVSPLYTNLHNFMRSGIASPLVDRLVDEILRFSNFVFPLHFPLTVLKGKRSN